MDPRPPVLVFEGPYSVALVLVSVLQGEGIESSVDDLPIGTSRGPELSRIYVARADEADARRVIAVADDRKRRL